MLENTTDYLPPNLEQDVNHCIATHDVMRVSRLEGEPFMEIAYPDLLKVFIKLIKIF